MLGVNHSLWAAGEVTIGPHGHCHQGSLQPPSPSVCLAGSSQQCLGLPFLPALSVKSPFHLFHLPCLCGQVGLPTFQGQQNLLPTSLCSKINSSQAEIKSPVVQLQGLAQFVELEVLLHVLQEGLLLQIVQQDLELEPARVLAEGFPALDDFTPPPGKNAGGQGREGPAGNFGGQCLFQGPLHKLEICPHGSSGPKKHGSFLIGNDLPLCKGLLPSCLGFVMLINPLLLPCLPTWSMVKFWSQCRLDAHFWDGLEDGGGDLGHFPIQSNGDGEVGGQGGIAQSLDAEDCCSKQGMKHKEINVRGCQGAPACAKACVENIPHWPSGPPPILNPLRFDLKITSNQIWLSMPQNMSCKLEEEVGIFSLNPCPCDCIEAVDPDAPQGLCVASCPQDSALDNDLSWSHLDPGPPEYSHTS